MLLLDNIIFELQYVGGVSMVWRSILDACYKDNLDYRVLESAKNSFNNMCRPSYIDSAKLIKDKYPLFLRRHLDVVSSKNISLFHSSYYRVHRNPNVTNIVTVHDMICEMFDKGLRGKACSYQKKHALLKADVVICVSNNTKNDLIDCYPWVASRDIRVIHNGFNPLFSTARPSNNNFALNDEPYLLYVGGRNIHKNFSAAIEMIKLQESNSIGLHLMVVGGGEFTPDEESLIRRLQLTERVHCLGNVDDMTLLHLYFSAFALVYPSFYEGFGIPPLEAMAAGCPVICSNSSSIPEVVGNAGLLFDPNDIINAGKIIEELTDSLYRDDVINLGFNQSKKFSWESTGLNTLELYKQYL
jgi:mannosyltransferase